MGLSDVKHRGLLLIFSLAAAVVLVLVPWKSERPPTAQAPPTVEKRLGPNEQSESVARGFKGDSQPFQPSLLKRQKPAAKMTVEERNRLADELKGLGAPVLARRLSDLLQANGDPGQIDLAWRLLVPKLQTELEESDKAQIYANIESLLMGTELENHQKSQLIQMLGRTATPEALNLLLNIALQNSLPELRQLVHKMINDTGQVQWGGRFHDELSPMLEQAWRLSEKASGLREVLAVALAGVGAPSGIELLYAEALRAGETVSEFTAQEDNMAWHVLDVFRQVRNPEAIPALATRLGDQPLDSLALILSGTSLSSMGRPEATTALLHWAESSKRDVGQLLEPWLSEVRDPDSFTLLEQAVADPARFINLNNREALDRALREWHSRRNITTTTSEN